MFCFEISTSFISFPSCKYITLSLNFVIIFVNVSYLTSEVVSINIKLYFFLNIANTSLIFSSLILYFSSNIIPPANNASVFLFIFTINFSKLISFSLNSLKNSSSFIFSSILSGNLFTLNFLLNLLFIKSKSIINIFLFFSCFANIKIAVVFPYSFFSYKCYNLSPLSPLFSFF